MALPALPYRGQNPWYTERTNWDNAVEAELEGRLSQAVLESSFVSSDTQVINLADYGPASDFLGTIDNSAVLQQAGNDAFAKKLPLYVPRWMRVRINSAVNLRYIDIQFDGFLTVDAGATPYGVLVGDSSNVRVSRRILFNSVLRVNNTTQTNICVRVQGMMSGYSVFGRNDYIQLYSNEAEEPGTGDACAYGTYIFTGGSIRHLELLGEGGQSWVNENLFLGGDFRKITIGGTYNNNSNLFIKPSVEGADSLIDIQKGNRNKFMFARGEYGPGIKFGPGTYHNVITDGFASNVVSRTPGFVVLEDLGIENILTGTIDEFLEPHTLFRLDSEQKVFDTAANYPGTPVRPGLWKLKVNASFQSVVRTGPIPINSGTSRLRRIECASDAALWRPRIRLLDANRVQLDPSVTGALIDPTGGWSIAGGGTADAYYQFGAAKDNWTLLITSPLVAFVDIEIQSSGSTAGMSFERLSLTGFRQGRDSEGLIDIWRRAFSSDLYGATPTQGRGWRGVSIENATNRSTCIASANTRLSSAAASGATTLNVASTSGMLASDIVGVILTDGTTHWGSITTVNSGTQLTVSPALTGAAPSGAEVETARWATR